MAAKKPIESRQKNRIPSDRELMALPRDGHKRELLGGKIIAHPCGALRGMLVMDLFYTLNTFVREKKLGEVLTAHTGFRLKSRDVLCPDISLITAARLPGIGKGFVEGAPDMVIEFLSLSVLKKRLSAKLIQYFDKGTRLAWVVDYKRKAVTVYRAAGQRRVLDESQELSGEPVVPGFKLAVSSIFATPRYGR